MLEGVTGKLKGGLFLWCCYNNVVGEILACYEREKGIRRVVIKIHIENSRWFFIK